jgi:hypothetical protein
MRETRVAHVTYSREGVLRLLYGACIVCFLLGIFTIIYGELVSTIFLNMWYRAMYSGSLFSIGIVLLVLGLYSKRMFKQMYLIKHAPVERAQSLGIVEPEALKQEPRLSTIPETPPTCKVASRANVIASEKIITSARESRSISGEIHLIIERYDVRHPREIVDSQC